MVLQLLFLNLVISVLTRAGVSRARVISYVRSREKNLAVGGRPNSLHRVGLAIDLEGDGDGLARAAGAWRSLGLDAVLKTNSVHFELDGPALRELGLDFRPPP